MSKQLRNKIAYWFFLVLGMVLLVNQYFIQGWTHAWYVEVIKTLLFGIFALRPLVLIEIQKSISTYFINLSKHNTSIQINEYEESFRSRDTGGSSVPPENEEQV